MKLIGYREANFRPDNGKGEEIKGYMIYLGNEIDPRRGGGMEAERQYLTQSKIDREGHLSAGAVRQGCQCLLQTAMVRLPASVPWTIEATPHRLW